MSPFYGSLAVALAFGLGIVADIGHVSGAYVNPAVTLECAATGKVPWGLVPGAALGGVLGAIGAWIASGGAAREVANVVAATLPAAGTCGRSWWRL